MQQLLTSALDAVFQVLRRVRWLIILGLVAFVGSGAAYAVLPSCDTVREAAPQPLTTSPTPQPTPTTASPSPTKSGPASPSPQPSPTGPAQRSAVNFTNAYTATTEPKDAWIAGVERYASDELTQGLRHTNRSTIPTGSSAQVNTTQEGHVSAQVTVTLTSHIKLRMTIGPGDCPNGFCVTNVEREA